MYAGCGISPIYSLLRGSYQDLHSIARDNKIIIQDFLCNRFMESPNIISRIETIRKNIQYRIFYSKNWLSVFRRQESSALDPEAKGPVWVSRVALFPPEDDHARQALLETIDCLSRTPEIYTKPQPAPVKGEWVGHRRNVSPQAPEPNITEKGKYHGLMRDVSSEVTMLYVHGGAF
jgi:hypothetical protein